MIYQWPDPEDEDEEQGIWCEWCGSEINEDEVQKCARCGASICDLCAEDGPDWQLLCEDCYYDWVP